MELGETEENNIDNAATFCGGIIRKMSWYRSVTESDRYMKAIPKIEAGSRVQQKGSIG